MNMKLQIKIETDDRRGRKAKHIANVEHCKNSNYYNIQKGHSSERQEIISTFRKNK